MIKAPRYFLACLVIALAFPQSNSQAKETYKFDPLHSCIRFTVHQFLGTTAGKFANFEGKIDIDRDHPEQSSVVAKIDVRSIDTGIAKRDDHLRSADFFNVAKYPEITFTSHSVKQTAAKSGDIVGDLTMHGVTRPITLHVTLISPISASASRTLWSVTTEPLKRRDFGLTFGQTAEAVSGISQTVAIRIEIEATRTQ
jgi:polyisoprenoid-binding protein YceI